MSPSCRSSAIHTSDCAHVSCLLPHSSSSPLVLLLVLWGSKILGSRQLAFACDELALWLALYMFLKMEVVFSQTKPAACEWLWYRFICFIQYLVFDALTYMFRLPVSVSGCPKSSKLSIPFVNNTCFCSTSVHSIVRNLSCAFLPARCNFCLQLNNIWEQNLQFNCTFVSPLHDHVLKL